VNDAATGRRRFGMSDSSRAIRGLVQEVRSAEGRSIRVRPTRVGLVTLLVVRAVLILTSAAAIAGLGAGIASRFIMRVATLIDSTPGVQGFTFRGTVMLIRDVIILYSLPAALLFGVARRLLPGSQLVKGASFGGFLFIVFFLAQLRPEQALIQVLFGFMCILYGIALSLLVAAIDSRIPRPQLTATT
jgi:hypothetical protein